MTNKCWKKIIVLRYVRYHEVSLHCVIVAKKWLTYLIESESDFPESSNHFFLYARCVKDQWAMSKVGGISLFQTLKKKFLAITIPYCAAMAFQWLSVSFWNYCFRCYYFLSCNQHLHRPVLQSSKRKEISHFSTTQC